MKKLGLAFATAGFLASTASANIGTGFYIGAHTGWDSTQAESRGPDSGSFVISGVPVNFTGSEKTKMGANNINFGIFFGYGQVYDSWYFGGEMGYAISNLKMSKNGESAVNLNNGNSEWSSTTSRKLKRNGYFNAALRVGYLISKNTMGYIRLGGNYGKWKGQLSRAYNGTLREDEGLSVAFSDDGNAFSKSMFSFAPGIGIETAINSNVRLRAESTYEIGSKIKQANGNLDFNRVQSVSVKFGVLYSF